MLMKELGHAHCQRNHIDHCKLSQIDPLIHRLCSNILEFRVTMAFTFYYVSGTDPSPDINSASFFNDDYPEHNDVRHGRGADVLSRLRPQPVLSPTREQQTLSKPQWRACSTILLRKQSSSMVDLYAEWANILLSGLRSDAHLQQLHKRPGHGCGHSRFSAIHGDGRQCKSADFDQHYLLSN